MHVVRSLVTTYEAEGNELDDGEARERFSRDVVAALEGTRPDITVGF